MLVPAEDDGGSVTDQPVVDAVAVAEELGRALYPGPVMATNVVADVIAADAVADRARCHLGPIARGETVAAWCLTGDGSPDADHVEVAGEPVGGGLRLDGVARFVHDAHVADLLLVAYRTAATLGQVLVPLPAAGVDTRVLGGLDLTRRLCEVRFSGAVVDDTPRRGLRTGCRRVDRSVGSPRDRAPGRRFGRCGRSAPRAHGRVRQGTRAVRACDRELPGDQAQARRTWSSSSRRTRRDALRRARDRGGPRRPRRGRRRRPARTHATRARTSAARPCKSTAESGSRGSTTCTSTSGGPRSTSCSTETQPGTGSACSRSLTRVSPRTPSRSRGTGGCVMDVTIAAIPPEYDAYRESSARSSRGTNRPWGGSRGRNSRPRRPGRRREAARLGPGTARRGLRDRAFPRRRRRARGSHPPRRAGADGDSVRAREPARGGCAAALRHRRPA